MSDVSTWLTANKDMPRREGSGPTLFRKQFTSGTALAQNDVILLASIPRYAIVKGAVLNVSGTIGASATLQLRRGTTALTAATTAAAATFLNQSVVDEPNTTVGTDSLNIVVAGAAAGTSATVTVELWFDWALD